MKMWVSLFLAKLQGKISKGDAELLQMMFERLDSGTYTFTDKTTVKTVKRHSEGQALRAIMDDDTGVWRRGILCSENGRLKVHKPLQKEIMNLIIEYNKTRRN